MNQSLYTDFEQAYELNEMELNHIQLLEMLKNGNIPERQIAAIKIQTIKSQEEASILMKNLTGVDGKIREVVALKINNLFLQDDFIKEIFIADENFVKIFADATIDINANICRLIVDSVALLAYDSKFSQAYVNYILEYASVALDELDKFIFRDKKYVINKQLFKLYWTLEALKYFVDFADKIKLESVLSRSITQSEYTIREKVAQILVKTNIYPELQMVLKTDENYYVREAFA